MTPLNLQNVTQYVKQNIGDFHQRRLEKVANIDLSEVLRKKNPYLFKAKNVTKASEIVESILSAYISSSEEGVFGNWLERLAIYINDSVFQGRKAAIPGMDLDFDRNGERYLVNIKSGPNWANKDQKKQMIDHFNSARKRLTTSGASTKVKCVNGCCYGRSNPKTEYKANGSYYKICGQRFWELISGDSTLYIELILPLGHESRERNDEFNKAYSELVNRFTKEFLTTYSSATGEIDWEKLVIFNSGIH
jgi:hypothetical protein